MYIEDYGIWVEIWNPGNYKQMDTIPYEVFSKQHVEEKALEAQTAEAEKQYAQKFGGAPRKYDVIVSIAGPTNRIKKEWKDKVFDVCRGTNAKCYWLRIDTCN